MRPGRTVRVVVSFDARVPEITEPGAYPATIALSSDTPYAIPAVPVTMTVICFAATAVLATAGSLVFEAPTLASFAPAWVEILYAGILSTAVAFTLLVAFGREAQSHAISPDRFALALQLHPSLALEHLDQVGLRLGRYRRRRFAAPPDCRHDVAQSHGAHD